MNQNLIEGRNENEELELSASLDQKENQPMPEAADLLSADTEIIL